MLMTPALQKLALTAHITFSVGLLGAIGAFLVLALAGLTADEQLVRAAYPAMEMIARQVIVPLTFAALLTGLVQSLGTAWGLFRHYWILAKLLLTTFAAAVLLAKIELIAHAARLASEAVLPLSELRTVGLQLAVHAAGGLLVLLAPVVLSVYKPRGLTPYGRKQQQISRMPAQKIYLPAMNSLSASSKPIGKFSDGGLITLKLRGSHMTGIAAIVIVLHLVILHITGTGLVSH